MHIDWLHLTLFALLCSTAGPLFVRRLGRYGAGQHHDYEPGSIWRAATSTPQEFGENTIGKDEP